MDSNDDKTRTHTILTEGMTVDQYRIVKKIGSGGMGEVYLAEDTKLKRQVALKFLPAQNISDSEFRIRFMREAEATAKLNHPNIITIFDVAEFNGRPFFSMELIEGDTIGDLLKSGKLNFEKIIELMIQICDGLQAAHKRKVVHRDIKPANIVIDSYGRPKILDFGLAAIQGSEQLTKTGSTMGTIRYMSPEQVQGGEIDQRSDLFSLGVVLYEMITERTPFERDSNIATLNAITHDKPEPLARYKTGVSDKLKQIIEKLLEKDKELRYQDAKSIIVDLKRLKSVDEEIEVERPSIAVLPFVNMSNDPEQEYFCEGIAEDILNDLVSVEGLRVVARTSSFAFKDKTEDLRDVGKKLNAGSILEGSVRKAGNRLRITAQLINAEDGYHLWSERFDRELDDIFAIQDEISASIVHALRIKLSPEKAHEKVKAPTQNMEAYELYLRGRVFLHQSGKNGTEFAIELFEKAIEADPNYAVAYAGLSEGFADRFLYFNNDPSNLKGAIDASNKALELNPLLAEAHSARGQAVALGKEYDEAAKSFKRAIELNPNLFEAYYQYARSSFVQGNTELAVQLYIKAIKAKPEDYQSYILVSNSLYKLGRADEAEANQRKGLEAIEKYRLLNPQDVRAVYLGATAYADLGDSELAIEWINKAIEMQPNDPDVMYNAACIYSRLEMADKAIELLKTAITSGFAHREWLESDEDLIFIRNHPDYQTILDSLS